MDWRRIAWSTVLIIMAFYAIRFVQRGCGAPAVKVGQTAPAFSAAKLSGKEVSSDSLAGRPYALVFFATWCGTCRSELPVVGRVMTDRPDLEVLVVSDESQGDVKRYFAAGDLAIDAAANGRSVFASYGVRVLPTVVVVDSKGRVAFAEPGGGAVSDGLAMLVEMSGG